jgi:hypothetical protein
MGKVPLSTLQRYILPTENGRPETTMQAPALQFDLFGANC